MPRARVIVFGYGALALASLDALEGLGVTPVAVVLPGNRSGADVDLVIARARARGWVLLVQPPRKSLAPFLDAIRDLRPDVLLVWSYSMLLPTALIALARLGAINVHGGLLPEYRGGHVMQWAIINGEKETGATLHYMDAGIDTGPVIADARFPIRPDDDAVAVRRNLERAGAELLRRWWPQIEAETAPRVPQDETRARYWPMRTREDGRIDWTATSEGICRLVRGLACNEPGAFVEIDRRMITIREAHRLVATAGGRPGDVGAAGADGVRVHAGDEDVLVTKLVVDGVIRQGAAVAEVLRRGASLSASVPSS